MQAIFEPDSYAVDSNGDPQIPAGTGWVEINGNEVNIHPAVGAGSVHVTPGTDVQRLLQAQDALEAAIRLLLTRSYWTD